MRAKRARRTGTFRVAAREREPGALHARIPAHVPRSNRAQRMNAPLARRVHRLAMRRRVTRSLRNFTHRSHAARF
jgi:hypothetical protein